jgi:hypothetical protein
VPKKKASKANRRKKSRTLPLVVSEPKLSARSTHRAKSAKGRASARGPTQSGMAFHPLSPWNLAVRQQSRMAASIAGALRIQRQIFHIWLGLLSAVMPISPISRETGTKARVVRS